MDSLSLTRMNAAFEEGIDISPICPRTSTATYARAREGRCRKQKPFRLARVLMRERACARTRPRRGGNGYCAAPSLRYARVRVRTSDLIRIFFSFGETDKIIQKIVLFSPFEKNRNISVCRSYTGRIFPSPSTPSLLRPAVRYTLIYVSPPSSPLSQPPSPLSPAPLASGGISTAGVFRLPRNVGRVAAKGGNRGWCLRRDFCCYHLYPAQRHLFILESCPLV